APAGILTISNPRMRMPDHRPHPHQLPKLSPSRSAFSRLRLSNSLLSSVSLDSSPPVLDSLPFSVLSLRLGGSRPSLIPSRRLTREPVDSAGSSSAPCRRACPCAAPCNRSSPLGIPCGTSPGTRRPLPDNRP